MQHGVTSKLAIINIIREHTSIKNGKITVEQN